MSTYNISGGNQGAVGDGARAENFAQNAILEAQLGDLVAELTKRATSPEQLAAVRQISEAQQAARNNDEKTVRQKLKAAGAWAFSVATEIGKDVAAKVISSQLGA